MNEARIKLAEARGYVRVKSTAKHWYFPKGSAAEGSTIGLVGLPDPFTNANADYAVLEWMRDTYIDIMGSSKVWQDFEAALLTCRSQGCETHWVTYRIGDYARAACKALGIKEQT